MQRKQFIAPEIILTVISASDIISSSPIDGEEGGITLPGDGSGEGFIDGWY